MMTTMMMMLITLSNIDLFNLEGATAQLAEVFYCGPWNGKASFNEENTPCRCWTLLLLVIPVHSLV